MVTALREPAQGLHQSPPMIEHIGFLTIIDQSPSGLTGGYLILNRSGRPLEFHCTLPVVPTHIQEILYGNTLQPFLFGERIAHTLLQRSKLPVSAVFTNQAAVLPVQSLASIPVIYVFGNDVFEDSAVKTPTEKTIHEAEATDTKEIDSNEPLSEQPSSNQPLSEPPREISAELSESLKTFNIEHHYRTKSTRPNEVHRVPQLSGYDTRHWQEVYLGNRSIAVPEMHALDKAAPDKNTPNKEHLDREHLMTEIKELARTIDYLEPFDRIRRALDEAKNAA